MSKINDTEDLLRSVHAYVKANLNTQIAAINTEKDDFLIDEITADDSHYVFGGELLDVPNHAFINFSIDGDILMTNNYDDKASFPIIAIESIFDNPKAPNTYYKSLRYMRAIYETILGYESSVNEIDELSITKAIPMFVTTRHRNLVISGVNISVSLS